MPTRAARRAVRVGALLMVLAATLPAPSAPPAREFVQAVEFPYYLYPRALWERELVWLKTIGIRTVAFSIPWNWHQLAPGDYDFTGRTSPRRDLAGFVHLMRKLDLRAWVRPLPPVAEWRDGGTPVGPGSDAASRRSWLKQLEQIFAAQTASHGGPVAYVEGSALAIDAQPPPARVKTISANDPQALGVSRDAIVAGGSSGALLWTGVEDALYPAGWAPPGGAFLRRGAVGLNGEERATLGALLRGGALLRNWAALLGALQPVAVPKPAAGKLPDGVTVSELVSPAASVVSVTNRSASPFRDELRALDPVTRKPFVIPQVTVPPGESLWLPLAVSIGPDGLCRECSNFSGVEHLVYATAELLSIEFENGILAMEFAAPEEGEAILQLARQPVGPYLAAGKPTSFDWDDKTLRVRLPLPANSARGHRVRIGLAIEEPETSAFFNEAKRLVIGQKNAISTTYSSAEVAARSRLRLPKGFSAVPTVKSPNEIDYQVTVPADALHGDWANLAIEADGMLLGRARLQLFRLASFQLMRALEIRFGSETALPSDPPIVTADPKGGADLEISIRNHSPGIQTFRLEAAGEGMDFLPARTEVSVGAVEERRVSLRVFPGENLSGLRDWRLHVTSPSAPGFAVDLPMRLLLIPRGRTVVWKADLDGDGSPEWVIETAKMRAIFSEQDGGRWIEFNWKDSDLNFLPEQGAMAGAGPVKVGVLPDGLEFTARAWTRTVRVSETSLTMEQTTPLPPDGLTSEKRGNTTLTIDRPTPQRAVYTIR